MMEYYDDNAKSQWDAYFKMKGEERNPPNTNQLFYIRKKILNTKLTMGTGNYQANMLKEMYNQPYVKDAFPDEDVFVNHMKKALGL